MTILFVTHYTELYGANRSMLTLIQLLRLRFAVRPIVLVPNKEGSLLESLKEYKIQYYAMPYFWWILTYLETMPPRYRNIKMQLKNIKFAFKIKKMLQEHEIDIVYSNSVTINIGVLLACIMRVPHIWHFRESINQFGLKPTMPRLLSKLIINLPINKRFILISDFMVREYKDVLPSSKTIRIYNGVSMPKTYEQRLCNQINDTLQIACIGQLNTHKNQIELLKALVILKRRGINVHVHFIGTDANGYVEEMNRFVEQHNIENMFTIHGYMNNVFSILENCNLGVVTAKNEAFGRVTIEYMLMRMPVIASDSGANPELIDNGSTGMIYHLGNTEELADTIQKYVNNPVLLDEQGGKACSKAVEEFSAERNTELIYAEMLNLIKAKRWEN